jgi:hypothetical protein
MVASKWLKPPFAWLASRPFKSNEHVKKTHREQHGHYWSARVQMPNFGNRSEDFKWCGDW